MRKADLYQKSWVKLLQIFQNCNFTVLKHKLDEKHTLKVFVINIVATFTSLLKSQLADNAAKGIERNTQLIYEILVIIRNFPVFCGYLEILAAFTTKCFFP